jgi:hypothetical protein
MKKHRNIRRVDNDSKRTHAWLVQVQRDYKKTVKLFSDSLYGGKRKSLQAAINFRDQLFASDTHHYHWNKRIFLRSNNTSGIAGVGRYEVIDNPNTNHRRIFWLAVWDDEYGVRRQKRFSILLHGEEKAKKLAIAERKRKLKEVCLAKCQ